MSPATDTRHPATGSRTDPLADAPRTGWLAWSLAGLSLAMFVASVPLLVLAHSSREGADAWSTGIVGDLLVGVPFLAFPVVGALLASRRPRNPIGWILLVDGLLWMLATIIDYYGEYGLAIPGSLPFPVAVAALNDWLWVSAVGLLGIYLLLLFPDGRLPSRRWRPLAWLSGTVILLESATIALAPVPLENLGGGEVRNPFGIEGHPWLADAAIAILPLFPLCILASTVSLVMRFRRSGGEMRQQIKWIAFAAAFMGLLYLVLMSVGVANSLIVAETSGTGGEPPLWLENVMLLSFTGVPVAVGFAVLKYRLYDIEVIINRTLVYGALTVFLVLVYLGGVAAAQTVFRFLTGQDQQPQLAVVVSTLTIAALFNPLRKRIQDVVDRRFYRKKYDAAKMLEAFSAKLRDETNLDSLSTEMVSVVRETMQPEHVSLWLRGPEGEARR